MVGCGTTVIECKLLKRKSIGIDINPKAIHIAKQNLSFECQDSYNPELLVADARNLCMIENECVDLIIAHPPYLNIIKYSDDIDGDLSRISELKSFMCEMKKVSEELFRVLRQGRYCAVLIGDTRKKGHYVPISTFLLQTFLVTGFVLKEDIIKIQYNCTSSPYWKKMVNKYGFYLIMHEHLFIFRKPLLNENLTQLKYSTYQGFEELLNTIDELHNFK